MIFSWIFLTSLGMLTGRYYKFLKAEKKLCGVPFWFFLHRPLLIVSSLFSLTGFLVQMSKLKWKWVASDNILLQLDFIHSILGISALSFTFFQVHNLTVTMKMKVGHRTVLHFNCPFLN
jgi:hypothetical protein